MNAVTDDALHWLSGKPGRVLVVPTNLIIRADRRAVMGAGLARQVRDAFPGIDEEYGRALLNARRAVSARPADIRWDGFLHVSSDRPLIMLPTKIDWQKPAVPSLIRANLASLRTWMEEHPQAEVGVPLLGAGLGELDPDAMRTLIRRAVPDATLITRPEAPTPAPPSEGLMNLVCGKRILVVTGHRPDKLGGYSETVRAHGVARAESVLRDFKPEVLVHGGALGVDEWFAQAAMNLGAPTVMASPCLAHSSRWSLEDQTRHAEHVKYARRTGGYHVVHNVTYAEVGPACMQHRNEFMLHLLAHSSEHARLAAVWDGERGGGTFNCLQAVRKLGLAERYLGNYYRRFLAGHPEPARLPEGAQRVWDAATPRAA